MYLPLDLNSRGLAYSKFSSGLIVAGVELGSSDALNCLEAR